MQINNDYRACQEHLLNLRREADNERLARIAQANHPKRSLYRPLLAGLGRQMSSLGQQLQDRYEAPESLVMQS